MFRPMRFAASRVAFLPRLSTCPRRQFGSTSPACAIRAVFSQTDNEELNAILKKIQETIIFPAYLPAKQRKLIFDARARDELEMNPVIIEIEDQKYRFPPLDRSKDVPKVSTAFLDAVYKMQTPRDWENLPTLLAGYLKAQIQLRSSVYGKMCRVAARTGNIQAIIECAKQSKETGFAFRTWELIHRTFVANNARIYENSGDRRKMMQAYSQVVVLLDLLHRPEHTVVESNSRSRPQFSPLVRGMHLYALCSAIKAKQLDGKDAEKDMDHLREELKQFTPLWNEAAISDISSIPEVQSSCPSEDTKRSTQIGVNGYTYLQLMLQVARGCEMAVELVGDDARYLNRVRDAIIAHVAEFVRSAWGRDETWDDLYEKIMGQRPVWPAFEHREDLKHSYHKKLARKRAAVASDGASPPAWEMNQGGVDAPL
ncbi:hypothetical protein L249_7213 [Ophiocordyceps polyrhachis-furcata BCC 54312]|uniref:Uncharacterized protein n=1 Tax=Ophiocordyceps polyrhachis-furcata BCC 54312 TaxID=1330021 RepID=A0A367LB64_9HYPO|nr:hypothetical protein L249_7213 [Ophiocordyceps polyrhachis-furcata BCC 54312]